MNLMEKYLAKYESTKAATHVQEGKIIPTEKVSYLIYSQILGEHIWVAETEHDKVNLQEQGGQEVIYIREEIQKLKGMTPDHLRVIHLVKRAFPEGTVTDVTRDEQTRPF